MKMLLCFLYFYILEQSPLLIHLYKTAEEFYKGSSSTFSILWKMSFVMPVALLGFLSICKEDFTYNPSPEKVLRFSKNK